MINVNKKRYIFAVCLKRSKKFCAVIRNISIKMLSIENNSIILQKNTYGREEQFTVFRF